MYAAPRREATRKTEIRDASGDKDKDKDRDREKDKGKHRHRHLQQQQQQQQQQQHLELLTNEAFRRHCIEVSIGSSSSSSSSIQIIGYSTAHNALKLL
ncbi:uncharacterized protein EMH_0090620 [Eimeria mitis]|uniref:Uncharacterized protein n=1 Tax=Eimeria mitis TaxID=44415 RepID=U6KE47_9EIME|nr:uncharacterized protein EMH_0090620 [Eimeria mitis]CDJ34507.1 hypothetical protein EMH_0090620 [Eimeria mitis]